MPTTSVLLNWLKAARTVPGAPPDGSATDAAIDYILDGAGTVVLLASLALMPQSTMSKASLCRASNASDHGLGIALGVELARVAGRGLTPDKKSTVRIRISICTH